MMDTTLRDLHYPTLSHAGAEAAAAAAAARPADPPPSDGEYWADRVPSTDQLEAWAETFYRDGCLQIDDVLPPDRVDRLRDDLIETLGEDDTATALQLREGVVELLRKGPGTAKEVQAALMELLIAGGASGASSSLPSGATTLVFGADDSTLGEAREAAAQLVIDAPPPGPSFRIQTQMFSRSDEFLSLYDLEPVVSLAEMVLGDDCHVISNNGLRTVSGHAIDSWHQDDPPHFRVLDGAPPTNIQLPPLVISCNYYLTDVSEEDGDGTHVVPGSHLFGAVPPPSLEGTEWEPLIRTRSHKAGSVHIHNCQLWHRGGPNPGRARFITGVSYGRRLIGHKYFPFMNYEMPEHVYKDADDRRRRLLGFLPHGAYE